MSKKNVILVLKVGEVWIEGVYDIWLEVVNHFTKIFIEPNVDRPYQECIFFYSLSDDDHSLNGSL